MPSKPCFDVFFPAPLFLAHRFASFRFLPGVNPSNPGKTINFLTSPALKKYPDFFAPFRAFGFDLSSEFNGTLFRLPLRSVEQAARSRLSSSPQTGADLEGFLREFAELIPSCLLFLK
jgi:sacsin